MKSALPLAMIMLAASGGASLADSSIGPLAYIQQASEAPAALMGSLPTTQSLVGPILSVTSGLPDLGPQDGNLGLLSQEGDFNVATIQQSGTQNIALIRQSGAYNTASISQVGARHQAFVSQQGRNNVAVISQR